MKLLCVASVISMLVAVNTMAYAQGCTNVVHDGAFSCTLNDTNNNVAYWSTPLTCTVSSGSGSYNGVTVQKNSILEVGPPAAGLPGMDKLYSVTCDSGSFTIDCVLGVV